MTIEEINLDMKEEWIIKADATTVAEESCEIIKQAANDSINSNGIFRIVLAGGTTPGVVYKMLAKENYDWSKWEFYLGDERCLPTDSDERNSKMALQTWLNHINVPSNNIYFIPAELGAEDASKKYSESIKSKLPFDMVLLGMGEDGHTASLFPGHQHDNNELTHAVYDSPKPPSDRVSLSASCLSNSEQVLMIVTGEGKREAVKEWKNGEALPISKISAISKLTVILDQAAASDNI